jgi:hypothetical protein
MNAPTITQSSVVVRFKTAGSRNEAGFTSTDQDPALALVDAADEIARIAEIGGFGERVSKAVADARNRVRAELGITQKGEQA